MLSDGEGVAELQGDEDQYPEYEKDEESLILDDGHYTFPFRYLPESGKHTEVGHSWRLANIDNTPHRPCGEQASKGLDSELRQAIQVSRTPEYRQCYTSVPLAGRFAVTPGIHAGRTGTVC